MNLADLRNSVQRLLGTPSPPLDVRDVLEEEERHLSAPQAEPPLAPTPDEDRLRTVLARRHTVSRTALCLSGGGIRSASFAIGVMQGLACLGLLEEFDYLSTVSGGGYAGSWLSAWMLHAKKSAPSSECRRTSVGDQLAGACADPLQPEPEPLRHVREFSRYLDPKIGLFSIDVWTLIATVTRNLLANWLVLIPLLAAVLLVPRFYYAVLELGARTESALTRDRLLGASVVLLAAAAICLIVALRYVIRNLPSIGSSSGAQAQFIAGCLAPTVTAAGCITLYWAWHYKLTGSANSTLALFAAVIAMQVAVWAIWGHRAGSRPLTWLSAAIASALMATGWWFIEHGVFPDPLAHPRLYTTTALPLMLLLMCGAAAMFVIAAAAETEDEDYEWWARGGAWMLVVSASWLAGGVVVFFAPDAVDGVVRWITRFRLSTAQATTILSAVTVITGGVAAHAIGPGAGRHPSLLRRAVFTLAAPTFVALAVAVLSWADYAALTRIQSWRLLAYQHALGAGIDELVALSLLLAVVGLSMSYLVNVNKFSLHGMYRARLIRTFLGASRSKAVREPNPFTGFDPADNISMSDLRAVQRPLHIINAALNVVSASRLAWQDRKAESFTISALHCGSRLVGYRPSAEYGKQISLGTAMTLSGAAVAPNQGAQSSPSLAFLLTLFNARLGAWLGNPGPAGARTWRLRDPRLGPAPLFSELFGRTTDASPYVYLSDGGHFDNLGLYEMVLRRCHYIVVSDAGCDPDYTFDDLGNAIRKIRIDLGIPIVFNPAPRMTRKGRGKTNLHCAVATIDYRAVDGGGAQQGFLVYVKPTLAGDETMDIENYARASVRFPHEPTTDQWFDESQFESYRALGAHSIDMIARHIKTLNNAPPRIRDLYLAAESYVVAPDDRARAVASGDERMTV